MTDLPSVTGGDLLKALERAGFVVSRQRGSHHVVKHADGRWTTVPVHGGRDLDRRLLRQILREVDIDLDAFVRLLRE